MTDDQTKILSHAYQHIVDAGKLLSEPAMLDIPKIGDALDAVRNAEGAVGSLLA